MFGPKTQDKVNTRAPGTSTIALQADWSLPAPHDMQPCAVFALLGRMERFWTIQELSIRDGYFLDG